MTTLILNHDIKPESLVQVAYANNIKLELSSACQKRVQKSRSALDEIVRSGKAVYGVTTGVGDLCQTVISSSESQELSQRIIYSHACGIGDPLPHHLVRAFIFSTICQFIQGHSGVSLELVLSLVNLLNKNVTPWIPRETSSDYSLVHMSHVGLVLMGEGKAYYKDKLLPGSKALQQAGLKPLKLKEKEGLSLINGTTCLSALLSLITARGFSIQKLADMAGAFSFEVLNGNPQAFDRRLHALKGFDSQAKVAQNILKLTKGSQLIRENKKVSRIQDATSLRGIPQIHGACRDIINRAYNVASRELNTASDNPLIVNGPKGPEALSGYNPHGESLALMAEQLSMAFCEISNLSEKRINRLLTHSMSQLPAFLTPYPGLNSGLMIPHYIAANLVFKNQFNTNPMMGRGLPTSGLQEDHISQGLSAAYKVLDSLNNTETILAIEMMTTAQAFEFREYEKMGKGSRAIYDEIRQVVPPLENDRPLYIDIEKIIQKVTHSSFIPTIESVVGKL